VEHQQNRIALVVAADRYPLGLSVTEVSGRYLHRARASASGLHSWQVRRTGIVGAQCTLEIDQPLGCDRLCSVDPE